MTDNNNKSNSDDIRFSIIGEQVASALDKAEEATTHLDNFYRKRHGKGKESCFSLLKALFLKATTNTNRMNGFVYKQNQG